MLLNVRILRGEGGIRLEIGMRNSKNQFPNNGINYNSGSADFLYSQKSKASKVLPHGMNDAKSFAPVNGELKRLGIGPGHTSEKLPQHRPPRI